MEKENLKKIKFSTAIEARQKLSDDFHKWMTFYYVANGAILVALTTIYTAKGIENKGLIIFSSLGILVSIFWNLACKGYYYWSLNWIKLIKKFEKEYLGEENLVYGVFSDEVVKNEKTVFHPFEPYNISTPKLTMLFSLIAILSWTAILIYLIDANYVKILVLLFVVIFYYILPKLVKSREDSHHMRI